MLIITVSVGPQGGPAVGTRQNPNIYGLPARKHFVRYKINGFLAAPLITISTCASVCNPVSYRVSKSVQ